LTFLLRFTAIFVDDSFSSFGIKQHVLEGTWVYGRITDTVVTGVLEVFSDQKDQAVRKGCSGAAAWSVRRGGIIGMVAALTSEHKGHVIPIDHLRQVWPIGRTSERNTANFTRRAEVSLPAKLGHLLYHCDRELQEAQFDQAVEDNWRSLRGVVVCAIGGLPADMPNLCRDRCINVKLRDHLAALRIGKLPIVTKLHWPSDPNRSPPATTLLLRQQVKTAVNAGSALPTDIRAAVNNGVAPWIFSVLLEKKFFKLTDVPVLLDFIQFWREVGASGLNKPVVVFLMFQMDDSSANDAHLEHYFEQQLPAIASPPLVRLDTLSDFQPEDIRVWLQRIAVDAQLADDTLHEEILPSLWRRFPDQERLRLADVDEWLRAGMI
jgi:hypothetical protein